MPALAASDAERLLQFVAEADRVGGEQPFTSGLLIELGRLIEADFITYTEMDYVRRRELVYLPRPGDEDEIEGDLPEEEWELMHDHPVCRRWRKDGRFSALRLSDVIDRRELRASRFYAEVFKPWGIEHELKVRLSSPPWHGKTFMFNRSAGRRDFTKRDRLVLELLTPHLRRLWDAARTRRLLASALNALESASDREQHGIVLLGSGGEIEFASTPARRLLRTFFTPAHGNRLPDELGRWLAAGAPAPLRRRSRDRVLTVERSDGALVLSEQPRGAELTARENEVMGWVALGKTNAQIAELLWLSPGTVRKHLENVYAKLGVSTRTAAAARFLGALEPATS